MNRRRLRAVPLSLLLLAACWPVVPVHAQGERLVLAFYYAWYDEKTWTGSKTADLPLAAYRSADRATIERQVGEAMGSGIDALVQSWYGPGDNPTETNFRVLLDVAQARGFRATVDFECTSPFMPDLGSAIRGLQHAIGVHAQHPAFLRYGGKPVIFFWRQGRYSLETWASIRAQVDPERRTLWIAEGDNPAWLDVFDGLHMYTITWRVNTNPGYTASKMRQRVSAYNGDHGTQRVWVATAMAGYDDTHVAGRAGTYVYPRSPDYYRTTWQAAMASTPEMVVINSYNEWCEGTMIEPSVTYGSTYLDLTRELAGAYKRGAAGTSDEALQRAAPAATAVPTPTPVPTSTPTAVPTSTPTATASPTPTATASPTPTHTPTSTPTWTPTSLPTATSTVTPAPTVTPTPRPTSTPTTAQPAVVARTFTESVTYTVTAVSSRGANAGMTLPFSCPAALGIVLATGGVGWALRRRRLRER